MPGHHPMTWRGVAGRVRRSGQLTRDARRRGVAPIQPRHAVAAAPEGPHTTVEATIRPVGAGRYRRLDWAAGEAHLVRRDLGGDPGLERVERRRSLLYIAHHTDTHVCDAQSPARLEGGDVFGWVNPGSDGGHRPQETCTTQVLDRLVAATNAVATSPLSGAPMAWCIHTGDNTDNRTTAEVRWWIDVLDGRPVTPNTGAEGRYEGVQRSGWRAVWHPDRAAWDRRSQAGLPHLPRFLDAAVAPFDPVGLGVPWLAVFGNHDQIFQGTFGPSVGPRIDRLGPMLEGSSRKPVGPRGLGLAITHATVAGPSTARWERRAGTRGVMRVTPDPGARRALSTEEYLQALLADEGDPAGTGPGPVGHGFSAADVDDHTSWWTRFEGANVQVIGLDTCNHTHGDGGGIGPRQRAWLEAELARHHTRWRDQHGRWVTGGGPDRLVVLASHHTSWTMTNATDDAADPGRRLLGPAFVEMLDRFPNVVLWLNGHTHEHRIVAHDRSGASPGWWEVNTASAIDFGQQARTVELFDNGDATVSIVATVLDHAAPPGVPHRRDGRWSAAELASLSRELAANDDQWIDPLLLLGTPEDRNVELVVPATFALR